MYKSLVANNPTPGIHLDGATPEQLQVVAAGLDILGEDQKLYAVRWTGSEEIGDLC